VKTQLDFARIAQLPIDQRRDEVLTALNTKQVSAKEALELLRGEVPGAAEQRASGTNAYAADGGGATRARPLAKNAALYGVHMARDLGEPALLAGKADVARREIDQHLKHITAAKGDGQRLAIRALQDYLGKVGPDVIDAISAGGQVRDNGIGYVNARLREAGIDTTFEPIMDARSRAADRLSRPGELRGERGSITFSFRPHSDHTIQFLRSQGVMDTGMWGVTFSGTEAFNFRKNSDQSVSAQLRDLTKGFSGGSIDEVVSGFVKMMGEQALPRGGFTFEIDLDQVPRELHGHVKAALAGLTEYGAELKYVETDPVKIMDAARDSVAIGRRIDKLLEKPQSEWTKADWAEYREVHAAFHGQADRRFEQG
jgi:hypothetical protein